MNSLNPIPMKTPGTMHINLKDNTKPLKVIPAPRVPKQFEEPGENTIEDLINNGILARVSDTTDWCSPGFLVPKPDGRVRLVTDFTHLNRYVKRPVHPFLTTRYILQSIPHETVYFLKMKAVHCYFQLAWSEESSNITTFLLQLGNFKYLLAPMGLNSSSDQWYCIVLYCISRGHSCTQYRARGKGPFKVAPHSPNLMSPSSGSSPSSAALTT